MKRIILMLLIVFLAGCFDDPEDKHSQTGTEPVSESTNKSQPQSVQQLATSQAQSVQQPVKNLKLFIRAKYNLLLSSGHFAVDLPPGKFIAQVSVSFLNTTDFIDRQSTGFLQVYRPGTADVSLIVGARYYSNINGLRAVVENGGFFGGSPRGRPIFFSSTHEIDLRIEQTATQLIFSARRPSAGAWTSLYTLDNAPSTQGYTPSIGVSNLNKNAKVYFDNFCLNAEYAGGIQEMSIIRLLRDANWALSQAQQNLTASTPDIAAATAHITTATDKLGVAIVDAKAGLSASRFTSASNAKTALASLTTANKALLKIKTTIAKLPSAKANAQSKAITPVVTNLLSAASYLLGYKKGAAYFNKYLGVLSSECLMPTSAQSQSVQMIW